ncbi:Uncharacterized protein Fot_28868 [Forsythia ovata]|uniref:Uncharacterized protein n=1 Tax=Forsythia ovata TaxID=205694 RepID=A0ABD1TQC2_9LAMI
MAGDKNALVSTGRPMDDDHIDLTRGADPMQADDDHTTGDSPVPNLRFPLDHARQDMEVMRSCVLSQMSEACKRLVTDLEVVEDEKSMKIHHLKKKNSSLMKSCEASEARVKEREEKIDNIRCALAPRRRDLEQAAEQGQSVEQDGANDQADTPLQDEDGAYQLD